MVRRRGGALVAAEGLFQLLESEERHEGGRLREALLGQGRLSIPRVEWPPRRRSRPVDPALSACFPSIMASEACRRVGGLGRDPVRLGHRTNFAGEWRVRPFNPPIANCFTVARLNVWPACSGAWRYGWWGLGRYARRVPRMIRTVLVLRAPPGASDLGLVPWGRVVKLSSCGGRVRCR